MVQRRDPAHMARMRRAPRLASRAAMHEGLSTAQQEKIQLVSFPAKRTEFSAAFEKMITSCFHPATTSLSHLEKNLIVHLPALACLLQTVLPKMLTLRVPLSLKELACPVME